MKPRGRWRAHLLRLLAQQLGACCQLFDGHRAVAVYIVVGQHRRKVLGQAVERELVRGKVCTRTRVAEESTAGAFASRPTATHDVWRRALRPTHGRRGFGVQGPTAAPSRLRNGSWYRVRMTRPPHVALEARRPGYATLAGRSSPRCEGRRTLAAAVGEAAEAQSVAHNAHGEFSFGLGSRLPARHRRRRLYTRTPSGRGAAVPRRTGRKEHRGARGG